MNACSSCKHASLPQANGHEDLLWKQNVRSFKSCQTIINNTHDSSDARAASTSCTPETINVAFDRTEAVVLLPVQVVAS